MEINKKVEAKDSAWQIERQKNAANQVQGQRDSDGRHGKAAGAVGQDAVELNVAKEVSKELAPEHSPNFEEVKRRVLSGQYQCDGRKVAEKMLQTIGEEIYFAKLANEK